MMPDLGISTDITGIWWYFVFMQKWFIAWFYLLPRFLLPGIGLALVLYPWYRIAENATGLK